MNLEQAIETQRLRLLRIVAGFLALVAFVSVGPFSREFPRWVREFVLSVLSRAELAARFLVFTQARLIAVRIGSDIDQRQLFDCPASGQSGCEAEASDLLQRLKALRAVLENLPRHGLRLLRRIEKRVQRMGRANRTLHLTPCPETRAADMRFGWRLSGSRVERPPDKGSRQLWYDLTSPRFRAGGECAALKKLGAQCARALSGFCLAKTHLPLRVFRLCDLGT